MRFAIMHPVRLCIVLLSTWLAATAAPLPGPTAPQAARALAAAGYVIYPVSGQPRTLVLSSDEVAVLRRAATPGALPAGVLEIAVDAQHRLLHLPSTVTVAQWLDGVAATPEATPALAPVFYEQGRAGEAAARHIATLQLLLVGLDRAAANDAAAATGALSVAPSSTDQLWVLVYGSPYRMLWAAEALQRAGLRVEPQFTRARAKRAAPNDPLYNQQFYFKNTGQGGGTPGEDLNIEGLWPAASGAGVTIAVVDDGLEITHPDLAPNMVTDTSLNLNVLDNNSDPTPPSASNHGTICASFIAARGNNGLGMTGAAPLARLLGVRLLGTGKNGDSASDVQEGAAFGWRTDVVQISSNSWGPADDGKALSAPDTAALAALRAGTTTGRGGRGVLYFVAAGNGRDAGDYAGYDGYSGSRFAFAIGATDNRGKQAPFSESGPQVIACAAGQTSEGSDLQLLAADNIGARGVNTAASPEGDYTTSGTQGTSYSTPQAAGVAALMLQANPTLGWRDVKEIIIRTARKNDATDADWLNNGGGFHFSHKYGAGYVDAAAAVAAARTWTNLPAEISATQASTTVGVIPDNSATGATRTFTFSGATNLRVETVEVTVSITHANRGQLRLELTSPFGTRTVLGAPRAPDVGANFTNWTFSSPRHWGESGNGVWTVRVLDTVTGVEGSLTSASVTLYGAAPATAGSAPVISSAPAALSVATGTGATFTVAASGTGPFTYQWRKDGVAIVGATSATFTLASVSAADVGAYSVVVTNAGGATTSAAASLTLAGLSSNPGRLVNLSLLTSINSADDSFTMGTVIGGAGASGPKPILVRAAGPSLGAFGVGGTLPDPKLEFFSGSTKIGENDNWGGTTALSGAFAAVGAFPYTSADSKDAAIYNPAIASGGYSIRVSGNGTLGTVIAEIYDSTTPLSAFTTTTPRLVNVSVLKQVGPGFTVGFVIGGDSAATVLVRVIGPGLAAVGVPSGFLADPRLTLFAGSTKINENENWGGTAELSAAFTKVGAFPVPTNSLDAALVATLQPGSYSVQVAGPAGASGLVIVEVYAVP